MSKTKNEHYVPQRYLKNFYTTKKSKSYRINVFDKIKEEMRTNQNIDDVASERFFYDVNFRKIIQQAENDGIEIDEQKKKEAYSLDPQTLEKKFAEVVETTFFNPISNIIAAYTLTQKSAYSTAIAIPDTSRAIISYYIALQHMRTKEFKEQIKQLHIQGVKHVSKKVLENKLSNDFWEYFDLKFKKHHLNLLHNQYLIDTRMIEDFCKEYLKHIWFIAVSTNQTKFWTSDNPIVKKGYCGMNGIGSKGIELIFPLSSNIALVMRETEYFYSDIHKNGKFIVVDDSYIEYANSLQVEQCYRSVFSKDEQFKLAFDMVKKHPTLKNEKHDRFIMR